MVTERMMKIKDKRKLVTVSAHAAEDRTREHDVPSERKERMWCKNATSLVSG